LTGQDFNLTKNALKLLIILHGLLFLVLLFSVLDAQCSRHCERKYRKLRSLTGILQLLY